MDIQIFQKRYGLSNKDMAHICRCSLPTIQKWRSGDVKVTGPARQLMRLLDFSADGDPSKLRKDLAAMDRELGDRALENGNELVELEDSMNKVVDRLELMLESRRKERELAEIEARYRSVVELQDDPICRWKPDTTLTQVNKAYANLFSKFGDNLVGRKWIEFVPESKRAMLQMVVSDIVRRGEPEKMMHESLDRDGNLVYHEWQDVPVKDLRGDVTEFHSVGHDVTELVMLRQDAARALKAQDCLMELSEHPILIFDQNGTFITKNAHFDKEILQGSDWKTVWDMLPSPVESRFRKLLQRLSGSGQMQYHLNLNKTTWTLKARLLSGLPKQEAFLIVFEKEVEGRSQEVIQTRLAKEMIVGGTPYNLDLNASQQAVLEKDMEQLGHQTDVDRIYVFTIDWEEGLFDNILEWCGEGVEPHIDDLKRIPIDEYSWWIKRMQKRQWIKQENIELLPRTARDEKEILRAQGIQSVLVAPFEVDDKVTGFVGFDQTSHQRVWHSQEIEALKTLSKQAAILVKSAQAGES